MGFTIDIDTGGTFTDGFFAHGGEWRSVKTPTTPHDLTVCFAECISKGAQAFGVTLEDLLDRAEVVRFSNTIGTNCIIQRDGARLGLLVTAGCESMAPTLDRDGKPLVVAPEMVLGIDECAGTRAPSAELVVAAAQELVDRGARCLVVAFAGSDVDPANERAARAAIKHEYPREYLGSVPVFLASDISDRAGDQERLNASLLNAYIHGKLARLLYKAGEDLRRRGYGKTLLIGHNNGAAARVSKTRAINTYNSGPAAGLLGAREIGMLYGAECVLSADMGGTSFDFCARTTNRLGYVGLTASLVPNRRHAGVLRTVQRDRKEIDVFPTRYRVNTVWRLRAEFRKVGFDAVVHGHEAEPSYLQFSPVAYGFGKLLHLLTPPPLRTCLFAFGRKGVRQ